LDFSTIIASGYSQADYKNILTPDLIKPIKSLRSWAFIFCFLSIGLTTRFRELASAGKKPFWAFTIGGAIFDKKFVAQGSHTDNINAVLKEIL
jgi:uncharacterized membrane protein YadS